MQANQFAQLIKYTVDNTKVRFLFSNLPEGRIEVIINRQWAATICPAGLLRKEATLLFRYEHDSSETEIWGSYQTLANFLSDYSETGSISKAYQEWVDFLVIAEELGI